MSSLCCRKENLTDANPDADVTGTHSSWYRLSMLLVTFMLLLNTQPLMVYVKSPQFQGQIVETWYHENELFP